MNEYIYLYAPAIGFLAMLSGGFWGLGGGWFVVPAMLILGISDTIAAGASLTMMLFSSMFTVFRQLPQIGWKRGDWGLRAALPLGAASFVGGFFGEPLGHLLEVLCDSRKPHQFIYLILLGWILYYTLTTGGKPAQTASEIRSAALPTWKGGVIGFLVGVFGAMLGIGGGIIIRPVLRNLMLVPEKITGMIARLFIFITALSGASVYLVVAFFPASGKPCFDTLYIALLLTAGGAVGFPLGALMHKIVLQAGKEETAHRSSAWLVSIVFLGILCKITGFIVIGRIMMVICGLMIVVMLVVFTARAMRHSAVKL